MKPTWMIGAAACCVGLLWSFYVAKTNQRTLVETAQTCRARAEQGDGESQLNLGNMYYYGQGVPQDNGEAVDWYRKAADQGNSKAQNDLGNMYFYGRGVMQSYLDAVRWYRSAADQDDTRAQFSLGEMYAKGLGVPRDRAEADHWLRKAADKGDARAQLALGSRWAMFDPLTTSSLLLAAFVSLSLLISFAFPRKSRDDPRIRMSVSAGLFGLLWVAVDFCGLYFTDHIQSISVVNSIDFFKFLLAGIFASTLTTTIFPKVAKFALGACLLLFWAFNLTAIAHHNLGRLTPAMHLFYSVNGLLVGVSVSEIVILWIERRQTIG